MKYTNEESKRRERTGLCTSRFSNVQLEKKVYVIMEEWKNICFSLLLGLTKNRNREITAQCPKHKMGKGIWNMTVDYICSLYFVVDQ